MLLTILVLCVVLLCVITFWVPCCDVRYNVRIKKRCSVHLFFQLFVRAPIWRYLCLPANSGIQISCCVFGLCLFSSCVPYVASFFGLSLFVLPLLYSLTFIYYEHRQHDKKSCVYPANMFHCIVLNSCQHTWLYIDLTSCIQCNLC